MTIPAVLRRPLPTVHTLPAMTARLGGWVVAGLQRLGAWMERARARRQLAALDDHMLKDIGLSRCDAVHEADKPFWLE